MTIRDIGNMSYLELESLIEGLNRNAEKEKAEIEGTSKGEVRQHSMQDLLDLAMEGKGSF